MDLGAKGIGLCAGLLAAQVLGGCGGGSDLPTPVATISRESGAYYELESIELTADQDVTFYYTLDGTEPTVDSTSGAGPLRVPIDLTGTVTIKYFAINADGDVSDIGMATFTSKQDATFRISGVNGAPAFSVNDAPDDLQFSGTAVYDGGTDTLTVTLNVVSEVPRALFNWKMSVDSVTQGNLTEDGVIDTRDYRFYGPEALGPGAMVSRDWVFTGVDGTVDTIDLHTLLRDDAMFFSPGRWDDAMVAVDTATQLAVAVDGDSSSYLPGYDYHWRSHTMTADGTRIFAAHRNLPAVVSFDTTAFTFATSATLSLVGDSPEGVGSTNRVVLSPDEAYLYVGLKDGRHGASWSMDDINQNVSGSGDFAERAVARATLSVVRLDAKTMAEIDRVTFLTPTSATRDYSSLNGPFLNAQGTVAVALIPFEGKAVFIDTASMSVINTVDLGADYTRRPVSATFSRDSSRAYVCFANDQGLDTADTDGTIAVISMSDFSVSDLVPPTPSTDTGALYTGPDGRLYFARGTNLTIFDIEGSAEPIEVAQASRWLAFDRTGTWAALRAKGDAGWLRFELATNTVTDMDGDNGNGISLAPLPVVPNADQGIVTK